jgi:ABC-type polysaccharide/polyol phosphate transport system ATPase subunit
MLAIRISGLGRFFRPHLGLNGGSAENSWPHLLGILGFEVAPELPEGVQRSVVIGGQVLKGLSLDIDQGSVICLAGPTGSGKSVLLQILAGVLPPTEGRVEIYGAVTSLLDVGENLDGELSALENIDHQLRMNRVSIAGGELYARDVIAFAGLEGFEDIAVRHYSTGMTMRLSLAMALQSDPEILLLDDVLGVGDIEFQHRCLERLLLLKSAGCTMVLALGNDEMVRQLATRVITLGGGGVVSDQPPNRFLHWQHSTGVANFNWHVASHFPENDAAALRAVNIAQRPGISAAELDVEMEYDIKLAPQRCRPMIDVFSGKLIVFRSLYPSYLKLDSERSIRFAVRLPTDILGEGSYVIGTNFVSRHARNKYSLKHRNAVSIEIKRGNAQPQGKSSFPLIAADLSWEVETLPEAE